MMYVVTGFAGALLGGVITWLFFRGRLQGAGAALQERLRNREEQLAELRARHDTQETENRELRNEFAVLKTRLEEERRGTEEKLAVLERAKTEMTEAFKALSSEALQNNSKAIMEHAKLAFEKFHEGARGDLEKRQLAISELVRPVRESLGKVDEKLGKVEEIRREAYGALLAQVGTMQEGQQQLREETHRLVQALHKPTVRGRWGEIQLRRVVELAGMTGYCDFDEQVTVTTDEGRLRPDMVVKLPGGKRIVVDSKVALDAYLNAVEEQDEEKRAALLLQHAKQMRTHMLQLAGKAYWDHLTPTPEFVVMFIPGETFFSAALMQDPTLLEQGLEKRVIPASPTTLIALLRAIAYGWQQEKMAESAAEVSRTGRELYERVLKFVEHLEKVGRGLNSSVDAYNRAVGSLESRVLVSARRLKELGAGTTKVIGTLDAVDKFPRELQAPETAGEQE
jgi:DNA recombination protein RmuC